MKKNDLNFNSDKPQSDIRNTIRVSIHEGIFAQMHNTISAPGSVFITKFAVILGATPLQFGILAAMGQLSQVFQPLGVTITRKRTSRKKPVVNMVVLFRLLPLLYGFLPFLFPAHQAIWAFLLLFMLSTSLHATCYNMWIAWLSDMIPLRIRGRFFSRRNQWTMVSGLATGYILGAIIDLFDAEPGLMTNTVKSFIGDIAVLAPENLTYSFAIVFIFSTIMGLIGAKILNKQPEHPKPIEQDKFRNIAFDTLKDKNFRRLLFYGFWWMLAIGIGAPFWQPFMIKKLHMSIVGIQIYGTISTAFAFLALRPWGQIIDRFGNRTAMRFAILLGGLNPMIWLFASASNYWIVYIEAATSGIMWSGAQIVATNFVLSIAPDKKRQIYSGIFGAFSGVAMMLTMFFSGALMPQALNIIGFHLEPEQVLFAITGLTRWSAEIPLTWVQESRAKPMSAAIYYLGQIAKVRIARLAWWRNKKK